MRCLRQLHAGAARQRRAAARDPRARGRRAGLEHERPAARRPDRRRRAGTPTCSTDYEFVEDLGERDTFAGRHHRWIEKEAAGVVGAIAAYNYPIQLALAKLAPALAAGCTVVLKGAPDTPWATLALGKLIAEATDIPPGVVNVLASSDNAVGARADDASRRRRRVVHRLDAGRAPDHGGRERHREAGVPRARRQVGVRAARRRRRRRWPRCSARTRRSRTRARAARSRRGSSCRATGTTRSSTWRARCSPACRTAIRPIPANMMGPLISAPPAREGRGLRRPRDRRRRQGRGRRPHPRAPAARLLLRADAARRRRRELGGRAGRAVRSGARGAAARRRRRRGAHREQLDLRALGRGAERRPRARARASRGGSAPGR